DAAHLEPGVRVAVVPIEKVRSAALPVRDEEIEEAVVVVIAPRTTGGIAAVVHDAAGGHFGERAIAVVVIERLILPGTVGDKEVEEPIVVIVGPLTDFRLLRVGDDCARGDLRERAIAVVVIEETRPETRHGQVEVAIIIVVTPIRYKCIGAALTRANVPSLLFRNRKLKPPLLATYRSGKPSSSKSPHEPAIDEPPLVTTGLLVIRVTRPSRLC